MSGPQVALAAQWTLRVAGAMLLLAALRLARRAHELGVDGEHAYWLAPLAVLAGGYKSHRLMIPLLKRDATWLRSQAQVPAWRIYPPRLMLLIALMIAFSAAAKRLSMDWGWGLATMGTLDLAVGSALLLTSVALLRGE